MSPVILLYMIHYKTNIVETSLVLDFTLDFQNSLIWSYQNFILKNLISFESLNYINKLLLWIEYSRPNL